MHAREKLGTTVEAPLNVSFVSECTVDTPVVDRKAHSKLQVTLVQPRRPEERLNSPSLVQSP